MTEHQDLWPDIFGESDKKWPKVILAEQAKLLGEKTNNILVATVTTLQGFFKEYFPDAIGPTFKHQFILHAPLLGDYKLVLFEVYHDLESYPLFVFEMLTERQQKEYSESSFISRIKYILNDSTTQKVIQGLYTQSKIS